MSKDLQNKPKFSSDQAQPSRSDEKPAADTNVAKEAAAAWKGPTEAPTKPTYEDKQKKETGRESKDSGSSETKSSTKEASRSVENESAKQKDNASAKQSQSDDSSKSAQQSSKESQSESRNSAATGKQAEHIPTTSKEPEQRSESSKGSRDITTQPEKASGENQGGRDRGGRSQDSDSSPREKSSPAVTAPEARSDASSGKASDPKGGSDGSKAADAGRASDATKSPEARTADVPRQGEQARGADTVRDSGRQDAGKEAGPRSDTRQAEQVKEREPGGRATDQIAKRPDVPQDRAGRQFEKDPLAGGKPADGQIKEKIDQKIDAILLDGKQVGIGKQDRGQERVDPKDARQDAGQKVADVRGDAGPKIGGGGVGADARVDAGKRPDDTRLGERLGIIGGDKGVAAGRLDVTISADAVKLHLPEKGGQEINLTDRNTQKSMNDAFGLFDQNKFKQIATDFKQHVDLWTELTSKQFGGLKDTIANVLDAPKAAAMKELSAWAQDLSKRPDAQVDVRQELGHAVKMQLLDSLKRNDDVDKRHADLKDRCLTLLDEFKQIKTDLQGRCEEAIKIARSFFTAPIERTPVVHIADTPSKKLTDAEIDDLLNVRLREFVPLKSKQEDVEEKGDADKDEQAKAVQQAMQQGTHIVKKGETVASIAAKYCGTEECAVLIAEMNRGVITATYDKGNLVFHAPAGAVLNLPYDRDIREFKEKTLGLAGKPQDGSQS